MPGADDYSLHDNITLASLICTSL